MKSWYLIVWGKIFLGYTQDKDLYRFVYCIFKQSYIIYLDDCTGTTGAGEVIAPGVDPLVRCNLKCVTVVATE